MEKRELSEKELRERKFSLAKGTKYLLDFMFYAGILVTVSLSIWRQWRNITFRQ